MHFTPVVLSLALAAVPLAQAANCKRGLNYCGQTLLNIGKYDHQIREALRAAHQPEDAAHIKKSLFYCTGGSNGDISFAEYCKVRCVDDGAGKSDYCALARLHAPES